MRLELPFTKMVGTGNDFLVVEALRGELAALEGRWPRISRAACDRRYGVGADGLLVLEPSPLADVRMRIFNPDGSEAEMCGNGARCVALYIHRILKPRPARRNAGRVTIETQAGVVSARVRGEQVAMRMPLPRDLRLGMAVDIDHRLLRVDFVNTGVPHAVIAVPALDRVDVGRLGREVRFHQTFQPQGTNVDFIQQRSNRSDALRIRTYERGVEAETLACGTGIAAAAVIHAVRHAARRRAGVSTLCIQVQARSGETLRVRLALDSAAGSKAPRIDELTLEGAARLICRGVYAWQSPSPIGRQRKGV